jgi:hypothetical protein
MSWRKPVGSFVRVHVVASVGGGASRRSESSLAGAALGGGNSFVQISSAASSGASSSPSRLARRCWKNRRIARPTAHDAVAW